MKKALQRLGALVGLIGSVSLGVSLLRLQRGPPGPVAASASASASSRHGLLGSLLALSDGALTFRLSPCAFEDLLPHLQRYRCRARIAPPPALCSPGPPAAAASGSAPPLLLLLLAIKSHPAASDRRAALRRTWARPGQEAGGYRLQPLFLMATSSDARHARLARAESDAFADLLLWDFAESHQNLSLKQRCFLRWAHRHCPHAQHVFQGDDDIFVNVEALTAYLRETPNASGFIHGNIQNHSVVMRHGKYAVSSALYPMDRYPNFASGGGFIMPKGSLSGLFRASLWLPVFPLDDVYLGFLTLAAGLAHRHDERFRVWGPPQDTLAVYRESLVVHGLSLERMEQVWKELHGPSQDRA